MTQAQSKSNFKKATLIRAMLFLAIFAGLVTSCSRASRGLVNYSKPTELDSIPHTRVHFPFDMDEMFFKDVDLIDGNAEWLRRHKDAVVILEGHCDEHGKNDYNIELGDRRARTVKERLIESGVPHERIIMVVSYGETRPINSAHNNDAWQMNRRVEFILR